MALVEFDFDINEHNVFLTELNHKVIINSRRKNIPCIPSGNFSKFRLFTSFTIACTLQYKGVEWPLNASISFLDLLDTELNKICFQRKLINAGVRIKYS